MMAPLLARRSPADRAFERLYRRHVGDVYGYALAVLRNPDDAEDVTQTAFLNAYRAYRRGERPEAPKNWLIAIAHNVCRQRFRQAQRRPPETLLYDDAAELAVEEPEQQYSAQDLRRALGQIAFNQRAALVMRELEGRSYAEIAGIMELSVAAVETLIFRARRALREQLEGTLTCAEAERAVSKQADGRLSRSERGQLRAHLRECSDCAALARRQRATRGALKTLAAVPLPGSLSSFFGGGSSAVATGVAAKAAAVVCTGAVVGGVGYEGAKQARANHVRADPPAARAEHAAPAAVVVERAVPKARLTRAYSPAAGAVVARPRPRISVRAVAAPKPRRQKHQLHRPALAAASIAVARSAGRGRPVQKAPAQTAPVQKAHPVTPRAALRHLSKPKPVPATHLSHPVHPPHPARPVQAQQRGHLRHGPKPEPKHDEQAVKLAPAAAAEKPQKPKPEHLEHPPAPAVPTADASDPHGNGNGNVFKNP